MSHSTNDRRTDLAMGLGAPDDPIDISIILPAFNETDSVDGMYQQIVALFADEAYRYEILFIDDGSTDDTWAKIKELARADGRVRALRHRRNFGKASALSNGFAYARGDIMVTSDADMQYDPKDILKLIDKIHEGYDVVSAYKVVRRDPLSKRIPSWFFNYFVRTTSGIQLHDINAGLKAFRYQAAEDLMRYGYGELHRFFIVLAVRRGYRVAEVPVESLYRTNGHSKYGMERYLRGALDYLTVFFLSGYAERPLHFLGSAGLVLEVLGTAVFLGAAWTRITQGVAMESNLLLIVSALLILTGVQLLVAGLIAEMINNLERPRTADSKIVEVMGIDRRTSLMLAPGVQIERRRANREDIPVPAAGGKKPLKEPVLVRRRES